MDDSKVLFPFSTTVMSKVVTCYAVFRARFKHAARTARMEVARAAQEAVRVFRIMTFLHCAKDLPSVLKLYGIEHSSCPSPNEMQSLRVPPCQDCQDSAHVDTGKEAPARHILSDQLTAGSSKERSGVNVC